MAGVSDALRASEFERDATHQHQLQLQRGAEMVAGVFAEAKLWPALIKQHYAPQETFGSIACGAPS